MSSHLIANMHIVLTGRAFVGIWSLRVHLYTLAWYRLSPSPHMDASYADRSVPCFILGSSFQLGTNMFAAFSRSMIGSVNASSGLIGCLAFGSRTCVNLTTARSTTAPCSAAVSPPSIVPGVFDYITYLAHVLLG